MKYIDTNVFLRYFEGKQKVVSWFDKVNQKEEVLLIPSMVINEICWMLIKFYKKSKSQTLVFVEGIMARKNFKLVYDHDLVRALSLYKRLSIKFTDGVIASYMQEGDEIVSFDKDFDKIEGIKRIEI